MSKHKIIPLEKKIFIGAISFCVLMMLMIAYASWQYGITVPGCVKDLKPFTVGSLTKKSDLHYELHVVAKMWSFDPARIEVPTGSTLDIFLSSVDVNHGFHIDGTNVNLMAVPGAVNYAQITLTKPGDYNIVCHEYCGTAHHMMHAILHVGEGGGANIANQSAESISEAQTKNTSSPNLDPALVERGKKVYQEKICASCHTLNGEKSIGPTFKGLYGSQVAMSDDSVVTADDAYIIESIKLPQAKIVKGYESVPMPPLPVGDEDIKALIELIKSVR